MAALKEVRLRMKAVKGIQQVTNAMKMVATVKMRRVQDRLFQARPYTDALYEMAGRLGAAGEAAGDDLHPLLAKSRSDGKEAVVVMGSDRGLCGAFNMNLCRHLLSAIEGTRPGLIPVGRKVRDLLSRQSAHRASYEILREYEKLPFPATWADAEKIARDLLSIYTFSGLSRMRLAYQRFVSPGISRMTLAPWIPFAMPLPPRTAAAAGPAIELRCEPSVPAVLDLVLPRALTAQLYRALLESQASEQGARMVAMENATTNASELVGDLNLLANKLRQTGITKELLEITTGAEALGN